MRINNCKKMMLFGMIVIALIIANSVYVSADILSNESAKAKEAIDNAIKAIEEMQARNISILRPNESLQKALQLYEAQLALEKSGRSAKYDLVIKYALEVVDIKEKAFKAYDELIVFEEFFNSTAKEIDLSAAYSKNQEILKSFKEERYEDTLKLIDEGYKLVSEIEASHTMVNLFYEAVSGRIKRFLINNWKNILVVLAVFTVVGIIFRKPINKIRIKLKLNDLMSQKKSIDRLIRNLQHKYFETKEISESEYHVKITKFKEMLRDVERQIFITKEEYMKYSKPAVSEKVHTKPSNKKRSKRK